MAGLLDFIAALSGQPGGLLSTGGLAPSMFEGPGAMSNPAVQAVLAGQRQAPPQAQAQSAPSFAAATGGDRGVGQVYGNLPMGGPEQMPVGPQTAPQTHSGAAGMQVPQSAQSAPQASGGGLGGLLSNIFAPGAAGKNRTVQFLQQQGMDPGTATLVAGDKTLLRNYLATRAMPDPMQPLQMEKAQLEIEQMRNPTTDDIKEYQYAVKHGGYQGSLPQFMIEMRKAGATNVDARQMGNIPPGYRAEYDDQGRVTQLIPIPGGPVAAEAEAAERADKVKSDTAARYGNVVIEDIGRTVKAIEESPALTTGLVGEWMKAIPGTPAHRVGKLLDTVKANAGFDRLQAMRDSSPTGGALGQVSNIELGLLQAAIGNLEQSQNNEDLIYNLRRVQDIYNDIIHGPGNARSEPGEGKKRYRFNPETGELE